MNRLNREVVAFDDAAHVHQAGAVGSCDVFGSRTHVVFHLVLSHANRNFRLFDGKHASEAATFVYPLRLKNFNAFHQRKQVAQLGVIRNIPFTSAKRDATRVHRDNCCECLLYEGTRLSILSPVSRRARTRKYHKSSCCSGTHARLASKYPDDFLSQRPHNWRKDRPHTHIG